VAAEAETEAEAGRKLMWCWIMFSGNNALEHTVERAHPHELDASYTRVSV
jgi:hypothetical protein